MQPLHAWRLLLSARLLQATIEFHSRMKGELSAFAEQVLLCCFFIVRLFVNRRFMNCHVMLCVAVYGVFFSPQFDCSLRALSYVSFSRIAVVACFFTTCFELCLAGACAEVALRGIQHDFARPFLTFMIALVSLFSLCFFV